MTLKVLSVASEAVPLVKTGGLADVVGALPAALASHDVEVTTLLPGFPAVMKSIRKGRKIAEFESLLGEPARVVSARLDDGRKLLVLDAPAYFTREGGPYGDGSGADWNDNWRRFAALGNAAARLAGVGGKKGKFDLVHAHDWQAAMAPVYLRFGGHPVPSVLTIHNMAFQGYFGAEVFPRLGLPDSAWTMQGVEFHGGVGMLKGGMVCADAITTVSPTYAREIHTPAFGMGLDGVIRARTNLVQGILNGIDTAEWNPETDQHLAAHFSPQKLGKRKANKSAVEKAFGLETGDGPLFIVVSRLTWQKGIDVLLEVIDHLVGLGGRLALLGSGEPELEQGLKEAAERHPGKVGLKFAYDEPLSHLMQGGGDAILVPSRFEPCGLTQLYGLAYGCIPVVARTGGLADTVIDANPAAMAEKSATGVVFAQASYDELALAISRTIRLFDDPPAWRRLQRCAMRADFGWSASAAQYAGLYRRLVEAAKWA
ncbi:glycogen synthase GlgA [Alteraurantiacibacter aestuarii]|uniref:Glycogen synthase n=1 Tax=Alteraurantiacibacter aestuarii TaxID=650004 RepID=A0A844ZM60_9SPHN|nr:glycogen synthase GlgA [Alteraurantiacibacter aestuarii]MXO88140.1 glycogen synthase GlgA [Alteraurantiacibacter aestuarii]